MKYLKLTILAILMAGFTSKGYADEYTRHFGESPDIDVWTNKGDGSTFYYGEDVAVYFRAESDCYVVVYDIDPSGEVAVLFPTNYYNSAYVTGGQVYRIPDYYSDYTLEVSGRSGTENIFAVASYDYLNSPDFMRYVGYDYGDPDYYDNEYFVTYMRGNLDDFTNFVNNRISRGPYSVAHTRFYVDTAYRHHRHYRYWDYDPYYVGSVWIGCDFPGAEIWIDGIYFGIAPILIPRIFIGEHWLWAYYGGYPCYQRYFYVSAVQRYYIDIHVDGRYKDYRYRRTSFGGWHPLEKKYRNEKDFKERAGDARREKGIRSRSLPDHVIRDFDNRGIIKKDSPLAKRVRSSAEARVDDGVRALEKRRARQEIENRSVDRQRDVEKSKREITAPERKIDIQNSERSRDSYEFVPSKREKSRDSGEMREVEKRQPDRGSVKTETRKDSSRKSDSVREKERKSTQPSKSRMKKSGDSGGSRPQSDKSSGSRSSERQSKKSSSGRERRP